ncbi:hypothetical protein [Mycetocola zhadangensis]|uniref:YfhO family protein n=1 Tax=Mycetocola zhadangensis TaxID=1164595 RepID=A0A3L7ITD8_9MICO|nr:hypothetical protein [Mycetocola zhadangensis]RLQ81536.1 hypothetical protein D9V28_14440 [Mycetocola zhadangensis]RLQ82490.1 hypothetical protein D9V28_10950 [Mycetocola zhadangensis]GGF00840.1 hypothetical protein GCM10011313_24860 [Mycetocola zhadangensis]
MRSRFLWPLLVVLAILAGAAGTLLVNRSYFFVDDTQIGAYGQWYEIGTRILEGNWSPINPLVWQSGNYLAEGAWGLYSPPLWLIGLASHLVPNAMWFSTGVKVVCLVLGGLGMYVLSRTFAATRPFAAAVAAALPFVGVTYYLDAPSWVNGLLAWSFFGFAWGLARRAIFRGKGLVLSIFVCMLLIGIGYFHATLFLAVALAATLVEAILLRHGPTMVRGFVVSIGAGLFAVIVHLPALLTAGVSGRVQSVVNTGLLTADLSGIFASSTAVGVPQVGLWGVNFPDAPLLYTAWFFPLFFFIEWSKLAPLLRARVSVIVVLTVALVGVLLPSDFGPLRIPIRMMPYFALPLLVILAVGLSRAFLRPVPRRRFVAAVAFTVSSAWLTFVQSPKYGPAILLFTGVALLVFALIYRLTSAPTSQATGSPSGHLRSGRLTGLSATAVPVLMLAGACLVVVPQHVVHPNGPLTDYKVPHSVSDLRSPLAGAAGDVLVVGGIVDGIVHPDDWGETSIGNLWYVSDARVQNAYTSVFYPGYQDSLCMVYQGSTCADLYRKLFEIQPDTGNLLVDNLGVSSIQLVKRVFTANEWETVPAGWEIVEDSDQTRLISRKTQIAGAGGVVWTSEGMSVSNVVSSEDSVTFVADSVPAGGGSLALSRISWPGYEVSGGTVSSEPMDGFLMSVDVPASSEGQRVTVAFVNPGGKVQIIAAVLLVVLVLTWTVLWLAAKVQRRHRRNALSDPAGSGGLERLVLEHRLRSRATAAAPQPGSAPRAAGSNQAAVEEETNG